MSAVEVKLGITLQAACAHPSCSEFAWPLLNQLDSGRYDEMSVVNLQSNADWRADHRTARKRADRAARRGYDVFLQIDRSAYSDDINAVNQSATYRQGRPMSGAYLTDQLFQPLPDYPCLHHMIRDYGVVYDGHLVAYAFIYRSGELALVSQILGHADYLSDEIMYLLMEAVMENEYVTDPHGYLVYNRHDSGTDGLRFFKERCGFVPMGVEWLP